MLSRDPITPSGGKRRSHPAAGRELILDATGDERLARDWGADLAAELARGLPGGAAGLTANDVLAWLDASLPLRSHDPSRL